MFACVSNLQEIMVEPNRSIDLVTIWRWSSAMRLSLRAYFRRERLLVG
jgi:hypothetical protein